MKSVHCQIGAITLRAEQKPPGVSFTRHFDGDTGVFEKTWRLMSVSNDGALFRYERVPEIGVQA